MPHANKGADQPAHLHSLISTFVVQCLDSIISTCYSRNFKTLANLIVLSLTWSQTHEDRFSYDEAHIISASSCYLITGSLKMKICYYHLSKYHYLDTFIHWEAHATSPSCILRPSHKSMMCDAITLPILHIHPTVII